MSLGTGIFLFVVGAILRFALNVTVSWIDLQTVGDIVMVAGIVIVILSVVLLVRKRRTTVTSRESIDPATGERVNRSVRREDPTDPTL